MYLTYPLFYLLYIGLLGVVSKQLILLHGRVGDSTTLVEEYLSPTMRYAGQDAIASCCDE